MRLKSNWRGIKIGIAATLLRALFVLAGTRAGAQILVSTTLGWNPSAPSDIAGYHLYQGTASRNYTQRIEAGNLLSATAAGLTPGLTYYFAVSAYDTNGLESSLSSEISYTPQLSTTYYGFNLTDPTQALADSDGDGLANLFEYALGTNPLNPTDAGAGVHVSITEAGGNHYLTLQDKSRATAGAVPLQYLPEVSADKLTWYSDSNHVAVGSVTPLDTEFNLVTVRCYPYLCDGRPVSALAHHLGNHPERLPRVGRQRYLASRQ